MRQFEPQQHQTSDHEQSGDNGGTTSARRPSNATVIAPLKTASTVVSIVPGNGDINPYGLALVPDSTGKLKAGNLLVSNYNDKANNQGTGTTIIQISPTGQHALFAAIKARALPGACPGVGLTTALSALPDGYVVVGSLPSTNGKSATAKCGCLIVVYSSGKPVRTISGPQIQGPWDMTSITQGSATTLFVSNVLNDGTAKGLHTVDNSTVLRIRLPSHAGQPPTVTGRQVIANGIPWRDDPAALVIGPTGVALADNGDILTTNASNGNIVETTPAGKQLTAQTADRKTGAGSLFGLVINPAGNGVFYVNDGDNTLKLLH